MQSAFDVGRMPSIRQVEAIFDATTYSYEAGEYPPLLDAYTASFVSGDGGLLNALTFLKRALELLEVERMRRMVEPWHGKAAT